MIKYEEFNTLINDSLSIAGKYKSENSELWSEVTKQIDQIGKMYKHIKYGKETYDNSDRLDYGIALVKEYDSREEKKEMESLYKLFNLGVELELKLKKDAISFRH